MTYMYNCFVTTDSLYVHVFCNFLIPGEANGSFVYIFIYVYMGCQIWYYTYCGPYSEMLFYIYFFFCIIRIVDHIL